ncbi:MAG: DmsE family decaheme c-type cytochrome [Deltaproteobacteria bacterium]|nr:DmsE family decaheme c-type cytochrome [Deltaproteobacteria bacterium]
MPLKEKNWLWPLRLGLLLVLFGGILQALPAQAAAISCGECHDQITTDYGHTYHGRAGLAQGFDCLACHGPDERHLNDPSRENIVSYGKNSIQTITEQNQLCLECHKSTPEVSLWEMSRHCHNDVACVNCHKIHSRNSKVNEPAVCYTCHRDLRLAFNKISHHPIVEGKIKCSDCHNSHGTLTPKMLTDDDLNQLCYRCHAEKRGPFAWEHPPVSENCAICHDPHGSRHEKLLKDKVANLCQDCHNADLHSSRAYDAGSGFAKAKRAGSIGFAGRSCLNCHGNIHGSTHFEKRAFTR